jgi:hypothetical protein
MSIDTMVSGAATICSLADEIDEACRIVNDPSKRRMSFIDIGTILSYKLISS